MVGVHVQILAPFHHALQNGHETFQAFLPQTELLEAQSEEDRALPHFTVSCEAAWESLTIALLQTNPGNY